MGHVCLFLCMLNNFDRCPECYDIPCRSGLCHVTTKSVGILFGQKSDLSNSSHSFIFPFSLSLEWACASVIWRLAKGLGHVYIQNLFSGSLISEIFFLIFHLLVLYNLSSLTLQANKASKNYFFNLKWRHGTQVDWDLPSG